jgi:hypothetical protein
MSRAEAAHPRALTMRPLLPLILISATLAVPAHTQMNVTPFPREVFTAKTVAIVNNTHNDAVAEGAMEALKRWGRFTVVEDSDSADLTLTFNKKSEHDGASSQKPGDDGKPDYNYSMSFSSSIHMNAVMKGSNRSFYSATTSESKKKAGAECVTDLQSAFISRH